MTREEAKIFMSDRNDENPRLRWDNHVGIRTLHDRLIDEIYDDFESRTCENCKHVYEITHIGTDKIFGLDCSNYESDMYGNEVYNSIVCNKWESK